MSQKLIPVLFIQGAGEGAYEEDGAMVASLRDALGPEYKVVYPRMPAEENPEDRAWMAQISKELTSLDGTVILVGHSAGGAVLLKYLLREKISNSIAGVFLIAIPHWGPEDEGDGDYTLSAGFGARLPEGLPVFLYHSRDDKIVPFSHLSLYAEALPQAVVREFEGRGHQFRNDLSEIAVDIAHVKI